MANSYKKGFCLVLIVILLQVSILGSADAAKALYVFGDSFFDTGNLGNENYPFGETWPGEPGGRASDGRNQVDYFAELFGVPSPTPSLLLNDTSKSVNGVNFAQKGAGVTYAFGMTTLDTQVNNLTALVKSKALSESHLRESVALVGLGVNDYSIFNGDLTFKKSPYAYEVDASVDIVVNGIQSALLRLYDLGIRNVVVANLADVVCSPFITEASNFTSCSNNETLLYEAQMHNTLLTDRVRILNRALPGAHFIVADQYKAFDHLFHQGAKYGFEMPLVPCCYPGCSSVDDDTKLPKYNLCKDPKKAVIWDGIHPTDQASKVVVDLYASVPGFTQVGPPLKAWMRIHGV